jgi:hypothetical protein
VGEGDLHAAVVDEEVVIILAAIGCDSLGEEQVALAVDVVRGRPVGYGDVLLVEVKGVGTAVSVSAGLRRSM